MLVLLFLAVIPYTWGCAPITSTYPREMRMFVGNIDPNTRVVIAHKDWPRQNIFDNLSMRLKEALAIVVSTHASMFNNLGVTTEQAMEHTFIDIESIDNMITCQYGFTTTHSPFKCPGANSVENSCCVSPPSLTNYIIGLCEFEECTDQTFFHPTARVRINFVFRGENINAAYFISPQYSLEKIGEAQFFREFKAAILSKGWGGPGFSDITIGKV